MEKKFCQSCAMPLNGTNDEYGTNSDGTKNADYCKYCYKEGTFTSNVSMEEMIEICVPHVVSTNANMSEDQARNMMRQFFPTLKRWQKE